MDRRQVTWDLGLGAVRNGPSKCNIKSVVEKKVKKRERGSCFLSPPSLLLVMVVFSLSSSLSLSRPPYPIFSFYASRASDDSPPTPSSLALARLRLLVFAFGFLGQCQPWLLNPHHWQRAWASSPRPPGGLSPHCTAQERIRHAIHQAMVTMMVTTMTMCL